MLSQVSEKPIYKQKVKIMENEELIDVYRTLTNMASLFALDERTKKTPFIVAASEGTGEPTVIVSGKKDEIKELYKSIANGIIAEDEDDDELRFAPVNPDNEEDYYNDCLGGYCYDDCDDNCETVRSLQMPISDTMTVFEGFLEDGSIVDVDGNIYKIVFSYESPDGSCVYLKFTDNEVIENRIILLTAKHFPDISETTLFPLTEWEDVALRMEHMKNYMYNDDDGDGI